jgi:hypothetical protein
VREMMGGVEKALMVDDDERERRHTELSSSLMLEVQANMVTSKGEREDLLCYPISSGYSSH